MSVYVDRRSVLDEIPYSPMAYNLTTVVGSLAYNVP
jgi:hypothetical protein